MGFVSIFICSTNMKDGTHKISKNFIELDKAL